MFKEVLDELGVATKADLGKIKGEPLTRTDLSSATDQAKNIYPKGYEIIDKYIKQLQKG
jgi:hypothetical protein